MLSVYRLSVDNRDLGKFRSSGIIIATGTGSTGWLYSARQVSASQVNKLKRVIGLTKSDEEMPEVYDYKLAHIISQGTIFPPDSDNMYYFVREGF